jgi:hypothetical protein
MSAIDNLRLVYCSIFVTNDDTPEERRTWHNSTRDEQNAAARDYHKNYGGRCPEWAHR